MQAVLTAGETPHTGAPMGTSLDVLSGSPRSDLSEYSDVLLMEGDGSDANGDVHCEEETDSSDRQTECGSLREELEAAHQRSDSLAHENKTLYSSLVIEQARGKEMEREVDDLSQKLKQCQLDVHAIVTKWTAAQDRVEEQALFIGEIHKTFESQVIRLVDGLSDSQAEVIRLMDRLNDAQVEVQDLRMAKEKLQTDYLEMEFLNNSLGRRKPTLHRL